MFTIHIERFQKFWFSCQAVVFKQSLDYIVNRTPTTLNEARIYPRLSFNTQTKIYQADIGPCIDCHCCLSSQATPYSLFSFNRLFNRTQHCLDIMFDGCSYAEFHDFIHGPKFPYLASLASLCNYQNVINGEFPISFLPGFLSFSQVFHEFSHPDETTFRQLAHWDVTKRK